jgi:hypothetical protein|tara:strand:+ start:2547 stop:2732 length:186 start_codon:yes stop_codon:yes gene_type:complete
MKYKTKQKQSEYLFKTDTQTIRILAYNYDDALDVIKYLKEEIIVNEKGYLYVLTADNKRKI